MTTIEKRIAHMMELLKGQQGHTATVVYANGTRQTMPTYQAVIAAAGGGVVGFECEDPTAASLLAAVLCLDADDFNDLPEVKG